MWKDKIRNLIRKKPVISFFILTFLISWIIWIPLIGATEDSSRYVMLFLYIGGLGPLLSGIIVSKITNTLKDFKETNLKFKIPYIWYIVSIFLPILMYAFGYLLFILIGGEGINLAETPSFFIYPLLLLYVIFLGGGLEEPGWRGYALPNLQKKYSPFISSLIVGVFWIIWHLPLFFSELTSQQGIPLIWYSITAIALSFIFTIIYNKSKRSTVTSVLLHGGVNAPTAWFPMYAIVSTQYGDISSYVVIAFITWVTFFMLLLFLRPNFFTKE